MTLTSSPPRSRTRVAPAARRVPRDTDSWWPDIAAIVTAGSLLVVTALWVSNRGIQDLTAGGGTTVTSIGRLLGLWGANLLLIQVLLMARIPPIEQSFGQDRLARWHRVVGFTSFNLVVAHVVLIIFGYAASDRHSLLTETWDLVTNYAGMLLATAAFGLIIMVAVTSMRAARRRLRYESWHLLHLYAYLGVGLAIPHELWTGVDFNSSNLAQLYWWTAFGLAAGAILVFRVGLPVALTIRHQPRVAAVARESDDIVSVYVSGRNLDQLALSGQFLQWRFLSGPGWTRAHPYSISAAPRPEQLRITVKSLGDSSSHIGELQPGTRVLIEGAYGRMNARARRGRGVTLIGSGIGITPLRALLEDLEYASGDAVLIYRSRDESDLIFRDELDAIARRRGAKIVYLPGGRAHETSWLPDSAPKISDAAALRHLSPNIRDHDVFVCGPDPWMQSVQRAVSRLRVPAEQVHIERFDW